MKEITHRKLYLNVGRLPMGNHAFIAYLIGDAISDFNPSYSYPRVSSNSGLFEASFIHLFMRKNIFYPFHIFLSVSWIVLSNGLLMCRNSLNQLFFCITSLVKDVFNTLSLNKMGAGPILKSAIGRQGCRHSNQGGKIKCQ